MNNQVAQSQTFSLGDDDNPEAIRDVAVIVCACIISFYPIEAECLFLLPLSSMPYDFTIPHLWLKLQPKMPIATINSRNMISRGVRYTCKSD